VAVKGLRIAVFGTRGLPANYGGYESFAEEIMPRLVEMGHQVTVYARSGYTLEGRLSEYKGVRQIYAPYLKNLYLETPSHDFVSMLDSLRRRLDLYYVLGYMTAPVFTPVKATRRILVFNTDGIEWRRAKWEKVKQIIHFNEWYCSKIADHLVSDALAIQDYWRQAYGRDSAYLASGAYQLNPDDLAEDALDQWEAGKDGYYLVACRIDPDNGILEIIKDFVASGSSKELLIAGSMNYETPYWKACQDAASRGRVRFLGPVYGPMLIETLHLGAFGYIHGHHAGGTNPALVKAMACRNACFANETVYSREVLADTGFFWSKFQPGTLAERIRWAEANPGDTKSLGKRSQERAAEVYDWDAIARGHDDFFRRIARQRGLRV